MTHRRTRNNSSGQPSFGQLGRNDLLAFDRLAKELILEAIELGCTGRISAKGHCILRNRTGDTAAVPRHMTAPNRTAQNARAQVRRLLVAHCDIAGQDHKPATAAGDARMNRDPRPPRSPQRRRRESTPIDDS